MKSIYVLFITLFCIVGSLGELLQCKSESNPLQWVDMKPDCAKKLQSQVKKEIEAALTYLSMGAHFAKASHHRPGFSKFFFEAANEEREHAIKIIEYLLMRGDVETNKLEILNILTQKIDSSWESGVQALEKALKLETEVTESIRDIIQKCEKDETFNDYHLVDYLTTDFLDEQYKGQRDLAGKISTLNKMLKLHGALGEFLYDKKLLNGGI